MTKAMDVQKWGEVEKYTWDELSSHKWMDFRDVLFDSIGELSVNHIVVELGTVAMDTNTELSVSGVSMEHGGVSYSTDTILSPTGISMVRQRALMTTRTEMVVNNVISDHNYLQRMMDYLPLYERTSRIYKEILKAYDREFREIEQYLSIVDRNIFIDTTVEALPIHERDLGIRSKTSLRYDQRREQIEAMYRAAFDQTTEETIINVAAAYANGEVIVRKTTTPGIYDIKFIGKGVPENIIGLKQALDVIMPAHLGLTYTYSYATWDELKKYKWDDVANKTWDEIKVWEGDDQW